MTWSAVYLITCGKQMQAARGVILSLLHTPVVVGTLVIRGAVIAFNGSLLKFKAPTALNHMTRPLHELYRMRNAADASLRLRKQSI